MINQPEWVVLLHGMGRTRWSMGWMAWNLRKCGFRTVNYGYPSTQYTIETLARNHISRVIEACKKSTAGPIHFVTHSLGGIVLRVYLQSARLPEGSRIVMISPPNRGTELADKYRDRWLFQKLTGPGGQQLGTTNESLPNRLNPIQAEVGVITGDRSIEPWFSRFLPGPNDGRVTVERARLPELTDFLVVASSHPFIMFDRQVITASATFLCTGKFESTEVNIQ